MHPFFLRSPAHLWFSSSRQPAHEARAHTITVFISHFSPLGEGSGHHGPDPCCDHSSFADIA